MELEPGLGDADLEHMEAVPLEQLESALAIAGPGECILMEAAAELNGLMHPQVDDDPFAGFEEEPGPDIEAPVCIGVELDISLGIYTGAPNPKVKSRWAELTLYGRGQCYATCKHGHGACRLTRT